MYVSAMAGDVFWGLVEAMNYHRQQLEVLVISAIFVLPVNVIKTFLWNCFINSLEI